MSQLRQSLDDYLATRRALGYALTNVGHRLSSFVAFADAAGIQTVTTECALAWATLPAEAGSAYLSHRLGEVRGFARYLRSIDPDTQIPPTGLLPGCQHRPTPYIYSDSDIAALMDAARKLTRPLKATTFETLIGLLAATGMRVSEAIGLDRDDVDWANGLLLVRESKFGKSREVLLHSTTVRALKSYARRRDHLCPHSTIPSLFVSAWGTRPSYSTVQKTFYALVRQTGLDVQQSSTRAPRVHDLRHTFAVKTLAGWYRDGCDVETRMPLLSTYLGHVSPAGTYWYLSSTPELLALATKRLEASMGAGAGA
jgi:integrase